MGRHPIDSRFAMFVGRCTTSLERVPNCCRRGRVAMQPPGRGWGLMPKLFLGHSPRTHDVSVLDLLNVDIARAQSCADDDQHSIAHVPLSLPSLLLPLPLFRFRSLPLLPVNCFFFWEEGGVLRFCQSVASLSHIQQNKTKLSVEVVPPFPIGFFLISVVRVMPCSASST